MSGNNRTVKVAVDNSRVMDSHERASITVKSPTGKQITLYKRHLGKPTVTQAMKDAFWKCCNDPMVRFIGDVEVTIDEMDALLALSKMPYFG